MASRPSTSPAIAVGLSGPLAAALARPVGRSTLLDVHDVNGGCIARGTCVASKVCRGAPAARSATFFVVTSHSVELRDLVGK